jgi:hypothetical protein
MWLLSISDFLEVSVVFPDSSYLVPRTSSRQGAQLDGLKMRHQLLINQSSSFCIRVSSHSLGDWTRKNLRARLSSRGVSFHMDQSSWGLWSLERRTMKWRLKEQSYDTQSNVNEPWKYYTKWKKPDAKGHMHACVYRTSPHSANPFRLKAE